MRRLLMVVWAMIVFSSLYAVGVALEGTGVFALSPLELVGAGVISTVIGAALGWADKRWFGGGFWIPLRETEESAQLRSSLRGYVTSRQFVKWAVTTPAIAIASVFGITPLGPEYGQYVAGALTGAFAALMLIMTFTEWVEGREVIGA